LTGPPQVRYGARVAEFVEDCDMKRWILAAAVLLAAALPAASQFSFNEREVKATPSKIDKADVWAFDFRFKDPRMIKVNIPGRGERICWYLWYQVINRTGEPREIAPMFELVTLDHPGLYRDELLPLVVKQISKIEDPTGYQEIKTSVEITRKPIPASKPAEEAFPRAITGVAVWDGSAADPSKRDPKQRDLSDCTRFSIFLRHLSNGFVEVDSPVAGEPPITQYKTLQLNFRRRGDRYSVDPRDIEFVPPAQWIYRSAGRRIPVAAVVVDDDKGTEKKEK
jgi:hypothetical protein